MFNNRLPINKAGAVTPEKAKSRCTPGKDDATARLTVVSILCHILETSIPFLAGIAALMLVGGAG